MRAAAAEVEVAAPWGFAWRKPSLLHCYEENLAWLLTGAADLGPTHVVAEVDTALAPVRHRYALAEPPVADALAPAFADAGYETSRHLLMLHTGERNGLDATGTELATPDELAAAYDHYVRVDPDTAATRPAEVRAHIVEHQRTKGSWGVVREEIHVVREGGLPIAWAKAWIGDGVAQVEDVICLHTHRGRGLGRAVTSAATLACLDSGAEVVSIRAEEDDWPKELYAHLGYRVAAAMGVFVRAS